MGPDRSRLCRASFEPQLQENAVIPGLAAKKDARNEGRNLVLESEAELLLLAKGGVEALWADEDEEDDEGDEESDEL